jgi:prevent-host-death family protein
VLAALLPAMVGAWCYRQGMAYPLTAAQAHLGELVAESRQSHRPVTISEHGKPVAALISIADLEGRWRRWRRTWRTRPPGAAGSTSMDWTLRSTGSMQKPCHEPDRRLPADGAS